MRINQPVTQKEITFPPGYNLLSVTKPSSHISYASEDFCQVSGYTLDELIGQPHNMVRHPDMPPAAFENMWGSIKRGESWMGIVKNRCKNGDHYWVYAHVTPSFDSNRNIIGYHSNRRVPNPTTIKEVIQPLYRDLLTTEQQHANRKDGLNASVDMLTGMLKDKNVEYDEFIASVSRGH